MEHVFLTSSVENGMFFDLTKCNIQVTPGLSNPLWISVRFDVDIEAMKARVNESGATLSFPGRYFTV